MDAELNPSPRLAQSAAGEVDPPRILARDRDQPWRAALDHLVFPGLLAINVAMVYFANPVIGIGGTIALTIVVTRLLVAALEVLHPRDPAAHWYQDRSTISDIIYTVARTGFTRYLTLFMTWMVLQYHSMAVLHLWPSKLPFVVQLGLFFLVYQFLQYWQHRFKHEVPFLWTLHAVHHSPRTMHHFRMDRQHLGELVVFYVVVVIPLVAAGAPSTFFLYVALYDNFCNVINHSNIRHKLPRPLHYIIQTAELHHLHHSVDMRLGNTNFASLPLWDMVFGTYMAADTHNPGYGVPGDPVPHTFLGSMLYPFTKRARQP